jgi:tetratricopeptide (TPR) repeat protein
MDTQAIVEKAWALREADKLEESQKLLLKLLEEHPDDPFILFEVGGSYDVMGREDKAIPYYRKAIDEGLMGEDLQECLVCLGSSLRVVGKSRQAVEALEEAVEDFPDNNSGRAFLALAYYSDGRHHDAVKLLLELLLETSEDEDILAYEEPLTYYKDNLDEKFEP